MWYLLSHDHGEKEPVSALWAAAGFGFGGAILAAIIEGLVIPSSILNSLNPPLGPLLLVMLGVGFIEESCKFFPLAFFIYRKRYFNEHTDGIIYFAIAGLAFGIPENILYSIAFGSSVGVARIILTPLFHAATTSMVGYFLASAKTENRSLGRTGLVFLAAALLHGIYDFGLASRSPLLVVMSLMITIGITTVLFILFMRAGEKDQAGGLSAVGHNSFCRSCGHPNPSHNLYCTNCGKRA